MRDPATHVQTVFFRDGRLTAMPRRRPMMLAACAHLASRFEPERSYDEAEVNAILVNDAPDHATLRRHLVYEGFLRRDHGTYWRVET
jgi:hypothetical protein